MPSRIATSSGPWDSPAVNQRNMMTSLPCAAHWNGPSSLGETSADMPKQSYGPTSGQTNHNKVGQTGIWPGRHNRVGQTETVSYEPWGVAPTGIGSHRSHQDRCERADDHEWAEGDLALAARTARDHQRGTV